MKCVPRRVGTQGLPFRTVKGLSLNICWLHRCVLPKKKKNREKERERDLFYISEGKRKANDNKDIQGSAEVLGL